MPGQCEQALSAARRHGGREGCRHRPGRTQWWNGRRIDEGDVGSLDIDLSDPGRAVRSFMAAGRAFREGEISGLQAMFSALHFPDNLGFAEKSRRARLLYDVLTQALRLKNYESVYWDLIEPYRSNAHPLLYPKSLRNILEGLPFTAAGLDLLKKAEVNPEELAQVELDAFDAVQEGRRQDAIVALFSGHYLRAKHSIMQPIDELMIRIRQRIAAEREAWLLEAGRLLALVIWAAVLAAAANLMLLVARRRYARAEADSRDRAAPEVPVDS